MKNLNFIVLILISFFFASCANKNYTPSTKSHDKKYVYLKNEKVKLISQTHTNKVEYDTILACNNQRCYHTHNEIETVCGVSIFGNHSKGKGLCYSPFSSTNWTDELFQVRILWPFIPLMGTIRTVELNNKKFVSYLKNADIDSFYNYFNDNIQELLILDDFDVYHSLNKNGFSTDKKFPYFYDKALFFDKKTNTTLFIDLNLSHTNLIQSFIDSYLTPREAKKIVLPKEILMPTLPDTPILVKSEFETKKEFEDRVNEAMKKREKEIFSLQEKYRNDVEKRNKTIKNLEKKHKAEIDEINKEQIEKVENLPKVKMHYTKLALLFKTPKSYVRNASYDAETKTMYLNLQTNNNLEKVSIKNISSNNAKKLKETMYKVNINKKFEVNENNFSLKDIYIDGYKANFTDKIFKTENIKVAIDTKKAIIKEENQFSNFDLQNPNLIDRYEISTITFVDKNKKFDDELEKKLAKIKPSPIDNKKWLFVIGVEKYKESDDIIFAKRSADLFVKTIQKTQGISNRNTYALINEEATSGAIKDKLKLLLNEVKAGDTIYFYYNGHGIPDPNNKGEPYILPSDKIPDFITSDFEFSINNIYQKLSNSNASKIFAFTDSCFSGATDGKSQIKGVAATRLRPKAISFDESKMVVLSAGTGTQFSNAYMEKGHRMFSYFLIDSLISGNKDIEKIYINTNHNTSKASNELGPLKKQEPTIKGNRKLEL